MKDNISNRTKTGFIASGAMLIVYMAAYVNNKSFNSIKTIFDNKHDPTSESKFRS